MGGVPCSEKVVIGGNHDAALESIGPAAEGLLSSAVLLQDSCILLPGAGLKVYGNAHSTGTSHNRAWQTLSPTVSFCNDVDIVLTHECSPAIKKEVLSRSGPRLWASGHRHQLHGITV